MPGDNEPQKSQQPGPPPLRVRLVRYARGHPARVVAGCVVLVAILIAGDLFWRYLHSYESTDDAEVDGHIEAISSRVNGNVVAVYVENNQRVVAGQTLVELDTKDFQVASEQAEAGLSQAEAELAAEHPTVPITQTTNASSIADARAQVADAEAAVAAAARDMDAAFAQVRQAEVASAQAQTDEARYRGLAEKQEVSDEEYDHRQATAQADAALVESRRAAAEAARRAVAQQQARLAQARTKLTEAVRNDPRQLTMRRATVAVREANVQAARARLEQARLALSYCRIPAPTPGIVGNRTVEVGQHVQPGEQLLAVTDVQHLWVTANFKETQISRMRPGQRARIHVDALDTDFDGFVENLPGATGAKYSVLPPENATGNYVKVVQRLPVRIRLVKGQAGLERLRPGMSVEPRVWVR